MAAFCIGLLGCGSDGRRSATGPSIDAPIADAVPLTLSTVVVQRDGAYLAILTRADGDSVFLPVDGCQANIIFATLGGVDFPRPMTHDLFRSIADSLGLSVSHVLLDLDEDEAAAGLIAIAGSRRATLSASVGDALAVSQRVSAALLGTRTLLEQYSTPSPPQEGQTLSELSSAPVSPGPARKRKTHLAQTPGDFVEMRVLGLAQRFSDVAVVLIDPEERTAFTIFIGMCQAAAIFIGLRGDEHPAIQSHDLLHRLLQAGGARMTRAAVIDIVEDIYIGEVVLSASGRSLAIDARPSDALALALLTQAPILVLQDLLTRLGEDAELYLELFAGQEGGS